MTELPPELKKAELNFMSNGFITRKENYEGIRAIPSQVVASFLETARKKLKECCCSKGCDINDSGVCYCNNCRKVDAVLGEERKKGGVDEE